MSNVLLVKGHPLTSETSFSIKGLEAFKAAYTAANPDDTITVLDVFADNVPEIDADIANAFNALASGQAFDTPQKFQPFPPVLVGSNRWCICGFWSADRRLFMF